MIETAGAVVSGLGPGGVEDESGELVAPPPQAPRISSNMTAHTPPAIRTGLDTPVICCLGMWTPGSCRPGLPRRTAAIDGATPTAIDMPTAFPQSGGRLGTHLTPGHDPPDRQIVEAARCDGVEVRGAGQTCPRCCCAG